MLVEAQRPPPAGGGGDYDGGGSERSRGDGVAARGQRLGPKFESFWLRDSLAEDDALSPALDGDRRCDVCIVGGGYTGLWTAIALKEAVPGAHVAVIEARRCGSGGSGANVGFAVPLWAHFPLLRQMCGSDEALRLCRASAAAIDDIERLCRLHRTGVGLRRNGTVWGATCPAHAGVWNDVVEALEPFQVHPYRWVSGDEIHAFTGAHTFVAGVLEAGSATLHPGRLVRVLRRAALASGVEICEGTPMRRLHRESPPRVETPSGTITAERVVLALGTWSAALPELRPSIGVICTDVMVSEPQPHRIEAVGWSDGPALMSAHTFTEGLRTTTGGRVLYSKSGGALAFGARVDAALERPGHSPAQLRALLARRHPRLAEAPAARRWNGSIDRSRLGLPLFGRLPACPEVCYGFGYSGRGVLTTVLGGRILASLVRDADDEWADTGLVRPLRRDFPPEPFRYVGGLLVRGAIRRKDRLDDEGRAIGPLARTFYRLKPGGWTGTDPKRRAS